jgi:thiol-disulfide isomerase/thioredoxin
MELETMRPNPVFDENVYEDEVAVFEALADDIVVRVWGGDWCTDCRSQLPDFGAALDAAAVEHVEHYPVEKAEDGSKTGPQVEEYGIELIPTVVVERAPRSGADGASGERERGATDGSASEGRTGSGATRESSDPLAARETGEELARFVEEEDRPIAVYLAERLEQYVE